MTLFRNFEAVLTCFINDVQAGVHVQRSVQAQYQAAQLAGDEDEVLDHLGRGESVDDVAGRHEGVAGDVRLDGLGLCPQPQRV